MGNTKQSKKGRPPLKFDHDTVERLASIGCTDEEIATVLDINVRTIERRRVANDEFCRALEKGRAVGKTTLRRLQWNQAEAGHVTMMIWLGKQMLGQTDQQRVEHAGKLDVTSWLDVVKLAQSPSEDTD